MHRYPTVAQGRAVAVAQIQGAWLLALPNPMTVKGANTMIVERGARPDVRPKPKRARAVLAGVLGVGVGLVLGLGLGIGLGVLGWAWLRH